MLKLVTSMNVKLMNEHLFIQLQKAIGEGPHCIISMISLLTLSPNFFIICSFPFTHLPKT